MTQFRRTITLAALFASLALPALAQNRPAIERAEGRRAFPALRCLKAADLTDAQKADVKATLEAAKPNLQKAHQAIKADREKLRADIDAGADQAVIGQDVLNLRADEKALRAEMDAVRDQILVKLTPEQKAKVEDCLAAPKTRGFREGPFD